MNEVDLFDLTFNLPPEEIPALLDRECLGRPELRQRIEQLLAAHRRSNILDSPIAETKFERAILEFSRRELHVVLLALRLGWLREAQLLQAWKAAGGVASLLTALNSQGVSTADWEEKLGPLITQQQAVWGDNLARWCGSLHYSPDLQALLGVPSAFLETTGSLVDANPRVSCAPLLLETAPPPRYRVIRPHAEGGLGQVLLARDLELNRDVALKEIKPRFADDEFCRTRFVLEAQITGGLQHPGIVPVYSLGASATGRPYYAMRFIKGQPLSEAIAAYVAITNPSQRTMQFRNLLRRFLDLCNAMDYAHGHNVLHRDLKPANVMLGNHGETLVVDWGLAKSLDAGGESVADASSIAPASSGSATSAGSVLGTLAYMGPEQASGDPQRIGKPADIYSLGATLYALLTSQPPHQGKDRDEVRQRIQKGEFPRPREIQPDVPRPLEAICLKAMALDPDDRYATPRLLAEDVEAWLADEPLSAYSDTLVETGLRWLRKHQAWAISGGTALALATVVLTFATLWVNRARVEATQQRQLAVERYRDTRQAIDTWLVEMNDRLRFYPGIQQARLQLLETAAADLDRFARLQSPDPQLELERAKTYLKLGDVRRDLNQRAAAEESYAASESLLVALPKTAATLPDRDSELGRARLRQAGLMATTQPLEAEALLKAEIARLTTVAQETKAPPALAVLGALEINRAGLLIELHDHAQAADCLKLAREHFATLLRAHSQDVRYGKDAALVEVLLGKLALEAGHADEARQRFSVAIQRLASLLEREPDQLELLMSRADASVMLGNAHRQLGNWSGETRAYETAIDDYALTVQATPDWPPPRESLALTQIDLAQLDLQLGEPQRALEILGPGRELLEEFVRRFPQEPRFQELLAAADQVQGEASRELANTPEAAESLAHATARLASLVEQYPEVADYRERLAISESHEAQALEATAPDRARKLFAKATTALEQRAQQAPDLPRYRVSLALSLTRYGDFLLRQGSASEAAEILGQGQRVWKSLLGERAEPEHQRQAAWFLANCSVVAFRNPIEAQAAAQNACELTPGNGMNWLTLAVAQGRAGDWKAASTSLDKAQQLSATPEPFLLVWSAWSEGKTGNAEAAQRRLEEAKTLAAAKRPGNRELAALLTEVQADLQAATASK